MEMVSSNGNPSIIFPKIRGLKEAKCIEAAFREKALSPFIMKNILAFLLLLIFNSSYGQDTDKFFLTLHLSPELTFHKTDYAHRWREKDATQTFNTGVGLAIQYNLTDKLFAESGLGFISRRLKTVAFLRQSALPPPYQSFSRELVATTAVSFRTLELPFRSAIRCTVVGDQGYLLLQV